MRPASDARNEPISLACCPFCDQGRLFAFREEDSGDIYLHCEECERGYRDPDGLSVEQSFLTLDEPGEARAASRDEVLASRWRSLLLKQEPM
ncbi:MAG: hypothetical protein H6718_14995 [Polyangiaceae bacterium]|nr:hypothetical protein [Polyangiaceae bacterium]MCB9606212.1 hypothetical protein [Polyangiaceae bacterium]